MRQAVHAISDALADMGIRDVTRLRRLRFARHSAGRVGR